MTQERTETLLVNLLEWVYEHDDDFVNCALKAMDANKDELDELGCDVPEDEDEIKELKYLLNKANCCSLDKEEDSELVDLLNKYGYPEY